jgi:hypothetical protein
MYRINANFKQVGEYNFCHQNNKYEKQEHCKDCCNIIINKNKSKRHKCKKYDIYVRKIDYCKEFEK